MNTATSENERAKYNPPADRLTPETKPKLVERLLQLKATGIWNRHLLIIAGLMAGLGYVYYGVIPGFREVYVMLFFYPLIYAAIVFRLKGVIVIGLVFIGILLPRALPLVVEPGSLITSLVLATFPFLIGGLVATQLNYLEQRAEAYQEILSLNEELNIYIGQLQNAQRQLVQAAKITAIGELSASVAHEINNPLAGVMVYTKLLIKKLNNDSFDKSDALDTLSKVDSAVGFCSKVIKGLLDFARQSAPGSQPVAISNVIDQSISLTNHQAEMNHVRITRQEEPALPPVMGDFGQLQQVFTNLILNAIQAMPEGGTLTISSSITEDGQITVSVTDTGVGIPPENMDKLYTPFFTTKGIKGLGLGLAISYGIIERHGGKIMVQSEVGKGTTFTVSLPAYVYKGEVG